MERVWVVTWLPPYHDMGLIAGLLLPLYRGGSITVVPPPAFLQRPVRWLKAVSRVRPSHSGGPPFGFELCVDRITPEDRSTLDLAGWKVAAIGAEPIRPGTIDAFTRAFGPCGFRREAFYPCYGLAEATVFVTGGRVDDPPIVRRFDPSSLDPGQVARPSPEMPDGRALVGCGRPSPEERLAIVEPRTCVECAAGQVGEIWIAGPSVGSGYQGQPDESARIFGATLARAGETGFLRTGDLGFLDNGELFVTGRIKGLIIIRGVNHYPQDVELTAEACSPGAAEELRRSIRGRDRGRRPTRPRRGSRSCAPASGFGRSVRRGQTGDRRGARHRPGSHRPSGAGRDAQDDERQDPAGGVQGRVSRRNAEARV